MIHQAVLTSVEVHREAAARPPASVVVRRGDSLSEIAFRYHIEWPGLYEANRAIIGGDPNLITVGKRLRVPSAASAARLAASYRPAAVVQVPVSPAAATTEPVAAQPVAAQPVAAQPVAAQPVAAQAAPAGSFQQCVISRESGGDAQVMNGSGHYGLYQFSYSSWVGAGGSPGDFGHASAAEQNQVFATAYAQDGTSPWAPYDGC